MGYTPLADAVDGGHGDTVKNLIQQHNADPAKVPQVIIIMVITIRSDVIISIIMCG